MKKKKKSRPVLISIRGGTGGERAYEVFLDVGQSRIEQWVLIGGAEEDIVGDESFIQQGYPFELRFLLLLSLSLEIKFISLEANRLKSNVFRIRCDQDGWTVKEDMRKESVTTFHKVLNFSPLFTRYQAFHHFSQGKYRKCEKHIRPDKWSDCFQVDVGSMDTVWVEGKDLQIFYIGFG